jgi:hypothetical protein
MNVLQAKLDSWDMVYEFGLWLATEDRTPLHDVCTVRVG